ncbi:MAG: NDP-sugar synthase [Acidimicrobiales bacterium]|nr:NDP-sugar synthase [Acidimicrobiia bacterium]
MQALVLVGGFGTRLRPLTLNTPKQMLPIVGKPMIEHVVEHLAAHGVTEVVLSLGFAPEAFQEAYPDGVCAGLPLHYAIEPEPLDTAGAVRFAALDAGIDDTFLVLNGDVLTGLDVSALVERHQGFSAQATLHLTPVDDPSRYGVVSTDADGRVLGFVEKPAPGTAPTNWINAGTYVFEPTVLDHIAAGRRVSVEREVFPAMAQAGSLFAWESDDYWVDTGTPETYLQAQLDFLDGQRGPAHCGLDQTAVIKGTVERSEIGANCMVETGAVVRNSVLLAGAHIAAGARVEDAIIGWGSTVGEGATVRNLSVVGHEAHVPAETVLDGLTLAK